jgi:hypothetical protein
MKNPQIALFALFALAAFVSCSDTTDLASGNTLISISWTSSSSFSNAHTCYLTVAKGSFAITSGSMPDSSAIVYNQSVGSSTTTRYLNLTEDGAYTAFIYYDNDDNGKPSSNDLPVGVVQFTSTGGASVALAAPY